MRIQLDPSTLRFFENKMAIHNKVLTTTRIDSIAYALYTVERKSGLPPVTVHLSDAYHYTRADYLGRPSKIREGDFIFIARPEADFDISLIEEAREDGIGIGKFAKLQGALNYRRVCEYVAK